MSKEEDESQSIETIKARIALLEAEIKKPEGSTANEKDARTALLKKLLEERTKLNKKYDDYEKETARLKEYTDHQRQQLEQQEQEAQTRKNEEQERIQNFPYTEIQKLTQQSEVLLLPELFSRIATIIKTAKKKSAQFLTLNPTKEKDPSFLGPNLGSDFTQACIQLTDTVLAKKPNINCLDRKGKSALFYAIQIDTTLPSEAQFATKYLIKKGASAASADNGDTRLTLNILIDPINHSSFDEKFELFKLLIDAGANTDEGLLQYAALNSNKVLTFLLAEKKLLVDAGAPLTAWFEVMRHRSALAIQSWPRYNAALFTLLKFGAGLQTTWQSSSVITNDVAKLTQWLNEISPECVKHIVPNQVHKIDFVLLHDNEWITSFEDFLAVMKEQDEHSPTFLSTIAHSFNNLDMVKDERMRKLLQSVIRLEAVSETLEKANTNHEPANELEKGLLLYKKLKDKDENAYDRALKELCDLPDQLSIVKGRIVAL